MKIILLVALLLSIPLPASAQEEREECTLKNREFCGRWHDIVPSVQDRIVLGHKIYSPKDDSYIQLCDILDERTSENAKRKYSVLKCVYYKKLGDKTCEQANEKWHSIGRTSDLICTTLPSGEKVSYTEDIYEFYMLYIRYDTFRSKFATLYLQESDELSCVYSKWLDKPHEEYRDAYGCSSSVYKNERRLEPPEEDPRYRPYN